MTIIASYVHATRVRFQSHLTHTHNRQLTKQNALLLIIFRCTPHFVVNEKKTADTRRPWFFHVIPNNFHFCQLGIAISSGIFRHTVNIPCDVPVWRAARAEQYAKLNKLVLPNKFRKRRPVREKKSHRINRKKNYATKTHESIRNWNHSIGNNFLCSTFGRTRDALQNICHRLVATHSIDEFLLCSNSICILHTGQRSMLLLLEIKLHFVLFFYLMMRFKFVQH